MEGGEREREREREREKERDWENGEESLSEDKRAKRLPEIKKLYFMCNMSAEQVKEKSIYARHIKMDIRRKS